VILFAADPPKKDGTNAWILTTIQDTHRESVYTNRELHSVKANQSWFLFALVVIVGWLVVLTYRVWGPMGKVQRSWEEHEQLRVEHDALLVAVRGYFEIASHKEEKTTQTLETVKDQVCHTADALQEMKTAAAVVKEILPAVVPPPDPPGLGWAPGMPDRRKRGE
jgi:hypothetical protein